MAKITASQRKALEAAGYTVSGNSVKSPSGGTVAGYNENGNLWSGSSKVRDILKSEPTVSPKETRNYDSMSFKQAFSSARKEAGGDGGRFTWKGKLYTTDIAKATTPNTPRPPQKPNPGRGDGLREMAMRAIDRAETKAPAVSSAPKQPTGSAGTSSGVSRSGTDARVNRSAPGTIRPRAGWTSEGPIVTRPDSVRVQSKPAPTPETIQSNISAAKARMPKGLNFTDWKNAMTRSGKLFGPGEALDMYRAYKAGGSYSKGGSVSGKSRTGHTDHRTKGLFK